MTTVYRQRQEPRTDWFRILADLSRAQIGNRTVARKLVVSKSTVIGWKQGNEPRHSDGEKLLDLWLELPGNTRETIPMAKPFDWR